MPEFTIERDAPTPEYLQLAEQLRALVNTGAVPPGRRIPSEGQIHAATGLARTTIRRAVELLRRDGIIRTIPGRGSFAARRDT